MGVGPVVDLLKIAGYLVGGFIGLTILTMLADLVYRWGPLVKQAVCLLGAAVKSHPRKVVTPLSSIGAFVLILGGSYGLAEIMTADVPDETVGVVWFYFVIINMACLIKLAVLYKRYIRDESDEELETPSNYDHSGISKHDR